MSDAIITEEEVRKVVEVTIEKTMFKVFWLGFFIGTFTGVFALKILPEILRWIFS